MAKVSWSPEAIQDLFETIEFIALENADLAQEIETEALRKADGRGDFPESSSIVPEVANPNIREILIRGTFRLIYELDEDQILIIAFLRCKRQIQSTIKKRIQ